MKNHTLPHVIATLLAFTVMASGVAPKGADPCLAKIPTSPRKPLVLKLSPAFKLTPGQAKEPVPLRWTGGWVLPKIMIHSAHAGWFKIVASATHGEVVVERHRAAEGTEQIWLVSTTDPAKRHLLYTHHRRADVIFSDDNEWLVINDHAGSGYSAVLLYRQKTGLEYERVADLTASAWKYFNQRNGFKETPFDHAYAVAACWTSTDPPTLLIHLSGHTSGPAGILKQSQGWHCLYNTQTQSFSTDLDALNKTSIKP